MQAVAHLPGAPTKEIFAAYALPAAAKWALEQAELVICQVGSELVESCFRFTGSLPYRMQQELRRYFEAQAGKRFATSAAPLNSERGSVLIVAEFPQYKSDSTVTLRFQACLEPGHELIK